MAGNNARNSLIPSGRKRLLQKKIFLSNLTIIFSAYILNGISANVSGVYRGVGQGRGWGLFSAQNLKFIDQPWTLQSTIHINLYLQL